MTLRVRFLAEFTLSRKTRFFALLRMTCEGLRMTERGYFQVKHLYKESSLLYLGIYLTSFSTLLFEITLTRVFSVAQWYHFAFMVVSMALLGYGISGTFLMLFPSILKRDTYTLLSNSALLFAISSPLAYIISNQIAFDPIKIAWDSMQIIYILFYYILFSVPFFFSGMTISLAISKFTERVHRIYFSDLLGAGSGCLIYLHQPFSI